MILKILFFFFLRLKNFMPSFLAWIFWNDQIVLAYFFSNFSIKASFWSLCTFIRGLPSSPHLFMELWHIFYASPLQCNFVPHFTSTLSRALLQTWPFAMSFFTTNLIPWNLSSSQKSCFIMNFRFCHLIYSYKHLLPWNLSSSQKVVTKTLVPSSHPRHMAGTSIKDNIIQPRTRFRCEK